MKRALPELAAALAFAALLAAPAAARADLYRWLDPETGSVRYSNVPPPWYGDNPRGRGPAVEVIPAPRPPVAALAPEAKGGNGDVNALLNGAPPRSGNRAARPLPEFDARHKALLDRLANVPSLATAKDASQELQVAMVAYRDLMAEMDRVDPEGADARRARDEPLLKRIGEAYARRFGAAVAQPAR